MRLRTHNELLILIIYEHAESQASWHNIDYKIICRLTYSHLQFSCSKFYLYFSKDDYNAILHPRHIRAHSICAVLIVFFREHITLAFATKSNNLMQE